MGGSFKWKIDTETSEQKKCKQLIKKLEAARSRLTPIVDKIILSAVDRIQRGDDKFITACSLKAEQYQNVIWASEILREIEYQFKLNHSIRKWPNTDVIVNNVSVDYKSRVNSVKSRSVIIDESEIVELLELYEQMGEAVSKIVEQANGQKSALRSTSEKSCCPACTKCSKEQQTTYKNKSVRQKSDTNVFLKIQCVSDLSEGDKEDHLPFTLPTKCNKGLDPHYHLQLGGEPVTLKVNQANVKQGAVYCINTGSSEKEDDIKIVIKQCPDCFSTVIGSSTKIETSETQESHESVTLHGKETRDETNLGYSSEDLDTRSVKSVKSLDSKQKIPAKRKASSRSSKSACSCCPTSIRIIVTTSCGDISKTRIETCKCSKNKMDVVLDTVSVDKSTVRTTGNKNDDIEPLTTGNKNDDIEPVTTGNKDDDIEPVTTGNKDDDIEPVTTGNKDDDIEPVTTGNKDDDIEPVTTGNKNDDIEPVTTDNKNDDIEPVAKRSVLQLMRQRICSSMEFDVTTVHTRLRESEIEHTNPHIVVELKKMGVNKLLRASRPAKCCRKAILNEKQRNGLPYCVSLRSLPLMANDIEVIEQSYDMSVKKIKNTLNVSQNPTEKLAYYVSLGMDDFKPNINFPWVVPVYDVRLHDFESRRKTTTPESRLFILKKSVDEINSTESLNKVLSLFKEQEKRKKYRKCRTRSKICPKRYFILRKLKKHLEEFEIPLQIMNERNLSRKKAVRFKESRITNSDQNNYLNKLTEWNQLRGIYSKKKLLKNIFSNVGHQDKVSFLNTKKQITPKISQPISLDLTDIIFDFKNSSSESSYVTSQSNTSLEYKSLSHLLDFHFPSYKDSYVAKCEVLSKAVSARNSYEGGDYFYEPADKMLEVCLEKLDKLKKGPIFPIKSFSDTQLTITNRSCVTSGNSVANFWNHISEELYYASSAVTIFVKRTRSLGRTKKLPKWKQVTTVSEPIVSSSRKPVCNEEVDSKKKLEYYVSLVGGDLVWSSTLPLVPQTYKTYYNYSNDGHVKSTNDIPNSSGHHERNTPPNQSGHNTRQESAISVGGRERISEFLREDARGVSTSEIPRDENVRSSTSGTPRVKMSNTPSENPFESWGPYVVSDISLPRLHAVGIDPVVSKKEFNKVEATKPSKSVTSCGSKAKCVKICQTCTSKPSLEKNRKSSGKIDIKPKKSKGKIVDVVENKKRCGKEVCELYKNKTLVPDHKSKSCKEKKDKTFTISGKDNIEIVIKEKKVSVVKRKIPKSPKGKKSKETL